MKRKKRIHIDQEAWNLGYQAGITGKQAEPPPGVDNYSFSAGYVEGEEKQKNKNRPATFTG